MIGLLVARLKRIRIGCNGTVGQNKPWALLYEVLLKGGLLRVAVGLHYPLPDDSQAANHPGLSVLVSEVVQ